MEFDISKVVETIVMQAKENQEEFIFETIQPYCENILQMKINKEELKQILLNSIQRQQPKTGHWIDTGSGQECSECGEIQYGYDNFRCFCPNCGAKMEVEE